MSEHQDTAHATTVHPDGSVTVPSGAVRRQGLGPGDRVVVRVVAQTIDDRLREKGITEETVEAIVRTQLESRENVIAFLMSEGSLTGAARRRFRSAV